MPESPVAIVTGASSGVGEQTARLLSEQGFDLALVARSKDRLESLASALPTRSLLLPLDLSNTDNAISVVDRTLDAFSRLDCLINNAGYAPLAPIDHTPPDEIDRTFAINAIAPAKAIAGAWPHFLARQAGRIINVSSMATRSPFPGFFAYAASKSALNLMALSCHIEGQRHNIRAFAVAPGAIETPMLRRMFDEHAIPPEKCLSPGDVARVICSIALGEHDDKSGQTIDLPSP